MPVTAAELAQKIGATVDGDGTVPLHRCASLEDAGEGDVSFLANRRYARLLPTTGASAVILSKDDAGLAQCPARLIAKDPYFAWREALVALHGWRQQPLPGVSPQAHIDPSAIVEELCTIRPFAYIAPRARIGKRSIIYPHCYIGKGAVIGDDCVLYPGAVVYNGCTLGNRVILHAGAVVGSDGFGYAMHARPGEPPVHHKIPQVGSVVIEDDVEVGACSTIDRAAIGVTRIGQGTKIDNLVTIGHGVTVGRHNLFVAQVGISGSTKTGDYVALGGQVGIGGHLSIGDGVQVAAQSGVASDLPAHGQYGGSPAAPIKEARRAVLAINKLPELIQEVRALRKRLEQLEARIDQSSRQ